MKILCYVSVIASLNFNEVLSSNATSRAGNYAVPRGSTVRMSCIPPDVIIDESKIFGRKSFVWTNEEGKETVNPRMETLKTGELQITRAHEGDSGIYHCKFRPQAAFRHDGAASKIFVHKLIVYELSGHKFITVVAFDINKFGSEATITTLRHMMKAKICATDICAPGPVNSEKCEVTENERQRCEMSMTYEAVEPAQTVNCNEACVRETMIEKLKRAQKFLEAFLLAQSEDSQARLKPDMQTFDTKHVITCKAGYHLIDSNYEHCFPCLPGTFSEPETLKCNLCPIAFYQEKYGSQDCEQCKDDKTTEMAGSKSRDDCRPLTDTGILKDIKEGIASLFKG